MLHDLRFAARQLLRRPTYALLALATLALGIGATTAIFSVLYSVVLKPLPYDEPERLVRLYAVNPSEGATEDGLAPADALDFAAGLEGFETIGIGHPHGLSFTDEARPREYRTWVVSPGTLAMLGVEPAAGRTFRTEEGVPGRDRVVVLSHAVWRDRFGGDPEIPGRQVTIDGAPRTVVGVMPAGFRFPEPGVEMFAPWAPDPARLSRHARWLSAVGRLAPGVSLGEAQAEVDALAAHLEAEHPASNRGWGVKLVPYGEDLVRGVRPALVVLLAAVSLVLLIACANTANLLLTRSLGRRQEVGVRAALGAGRVRLARLVLAEALLLAFGGALLGLALAFWGVDLLVAVGPQELPRLDEVAIDRTVLGFSAAVVVVTTLLVGALPAIRLSRARPFEALRAGGYGFAVDRRSQGARRLLTVVQLAVSLALLLGAGLMLRSFVRVLDDDPGFRTEGVAGVQLFAYGDEYRRPGARETFLESIFAELGALPGVSSVGAVNAPPINEIGEGDSAVEVEGRAEAEPVQAGYRVATPGYLETLGVPVVRGRDFLPSDRADAAPVALVNETAARLYFAGEDPLGRRLRTRGDRWYTVVGVIGDVRHAHLETAPGPEVYFPFLQRPTGSVTLVLHTDRDPAALLGPAQERVWKVNPAQPIYRAFTMAELVRETTANRRLYTALIGLFAGVALTLAAIGLYGVISYSARQQTREIGVRMALGAGHREVLGLVLRQGAGVVALGLALGLAGGFVLARAARGMLYGVAAGDPATFLGVTLLLGTVALFACWLPARRAARLDPIEALRLG